MLKALPNVPTRLEVIALAGGLDLSTPQLSLRPGVARSAVNFECAISGGYARIDGYERYDGRSRPSSASVLVLSVSLSGSLSVGQTVNGQTSGATGVVAALDGAAVVLSKTTGTFAAAENLRVSTTVVGVIDAVGVIVSDFTKAATYALACQNLYRADITEVPGSGPVRGLFALGANLYAWRNNAGATACLLYKATASGWTAVTLRNELPFSAGSGSPPAEGATITKGAVSAAVQRVVLESGTWASGTAQGRFIVSTPSGGNFSAGALTGGATATLAGAQTAISFLPNGLFEHDIGDAGLGLRAYGCDGINRAFEFDGTVLVPLNTGLASDSPTHVKVHKQHLFLTYLTSLLTSGLADPYQWNALAGAAEIGAGQIITALMTLPGNSDAAALAVYTNNSTAVLYGTSGADWRLIEFNSGAGAKPRSPQRLRDGYVFDEAGVLSMASAQEFGNFQSASLTLGIRPFVQSRKTLVSDSLVSRDKSQYRLFFSDGYGLYLTVVNGRPMGVMPVQFPNPVSCACVGANDAGAELMFFGSTNGRVYQLDSGNSFDGEVIEASVELSFAAQRASQTSKRYRRIAMEIQGTGYAEFEVGQSLDFGAVVNPETRSTVDASPPYWDSFVWDSFLWDGAVLSPSYLSLDGTAENISFTFRQSSALWPSYVVNSVTLHYTPRRILRY